MKPYYAVSSPAAVIVSLVESGKARAPGDLAETEGPLAAQSDATGRGDLW